MRRVTAEPGAVDTTKFIRHPRKGSKLSAVSVIMYNYEIPFNDSEQIRRDFETDWKATVRKFKLDVGIEN